jgi:transcriptional regulator with XRE-family HTH domain
MMTIKIGIILRKLLDEQRLTLKAVSKGAGVPATTIAEWSNNRSPKNLLHAQRVAAFLGVSLHFLLFGEEDREEPLMKLLKEDVFSGTFEINVKRVRVK